LTHARLRESHMQPARVHVGAGDARMHALKSTKQSQRLHHFQSNIKQTRYVEVKNSRLPTEGAKYNCVSRTTVVGCVGQ